MLTESGKIQDGERFQERPREEADGRPATEALQGVKIWNSVSFGLDLCSVSLVAPSPVVLGDSFPT